MKKSMTASELAKKAGQSAELKQPYYKIKIAVTLLMYIIAFGILYLTHTYYSTIKNQLFFKNAKIKKLEGQINLITEIGLIFSYLIVTNWIFYFLLTTFTKKQENHFVNALARNISNSMQHFVIFLGVFSYILTNDEILCKKKQILLYANWFVISRILYTILSVLDAKFKSNLREVGSTLGVLTIIAILLQINGWNILDRL